MVRLDAPCSFARGTSETVWVSDIEHVYFKKTGELFLADSTSPVVMARDRIGALADLPAIGGQWSGYVTWGWVQQLIFASYFGVLFGRAFPVERSRRDLAKACLCSATAFSLVHLPNVWLMVFTFSGGIFGTLFFYQMFNLFALGFSHGLAGSLLNKLTPINFSVGPDQMPGR